MSDDKINLKVCWNCDHYDSFGSICTHYGIIKVAKDTCDNFTDEVIGDMRVEIYGLKTKIDILEKENKLLLNMVNGLTKSILE